MRTVRVALLVAAALVVPVCGFFLGALAAAVVTLPMPGQPTTVDTAVPVAGFAGAVAAAVGWIRLLRFAYYRHLRRLRSSGPVVPGKVLAARTSYAKNPRGPGHWMVRLRVAWTDPRDGGAREATKVFRFSQRDGQSAHDFERRHRAPSAIGVLPVRRSEFLLDVPELPAWWDR